MAQSRYEEAEKALEKACRGMPGNLDAVRALARVQALQGRLREAANTLQKGLLRGRNKHDVGDRYDTLLELAAVYRRQGKHNEAVDALDRARKLQPERVAALWEMARLYEQFHKPQVARTLYKMVARRHGKRAREVEALARWARMEQRLGNLERARKLFEKALAKVQKLKRKSTKLRSAVQRDLGKLLVQEGKAQKNEALLAKGVFLLEKAISGLRQKKGVQNQDWGEVALLLGRTLVELKRCKRAKRFLREAVKRLKRNGRPSFLMARCLLDGTESFAASDPAKREKAYRLLQKAHSLNPADTDIMFYLARLHLAHGLAKPALDLLQRIADTPQAAEADTLDFVLLKARALSRLGRHRRAVRAATRAVARDPKNPQALRLQALELRKAGAYKRAVDMLGSLLKETPNDYELLWNLGVALEMTGARARARATLARALARAPGKAPARIYLAWIELRAGNFRSALKRAMAAAELLGDHRLHALDVAAQAQLALGQNVAATATLVRALSLAQTEKEKNYIRKMLRKARAETGPTTKSKSRSKSAAPAAAGRKTQAPARVKAD